jgi:hypothetical protein
LSATEHNVITAQKWYTSATKPEIGLPSYNEAIFLIRMRKASPIGPMT